MSTYRNLKFIRRMAHRILALLGLALLCAIAGSGNHVYAQTDDNRDEANGGVIDSSAITRKLSSLDPLERQRAAEELARLAAVDQLKMVAGYRLQEKNARVRLALDWALYRMGKTSSLFYIVHDLDSSRHNQAQDYLAQLDSPDTLYVFLEPVNDKTRIGLLEVLARIGDAGTLEHIKSYTDHFDPKVAEAARFATREINQRLAQKQPDAPARPRQVGSKSETSP